jgi:hypothetical protein
MFIVKIGPGGVQEISVQALTEYFEDMDLAVYPLIRAELSRLDRKLKRASKKALQQFDSEERGAK